jgi:NarL family two-component system sensor histidine kinase YdfH
MQTISLTTNARPTTPVPLVTRPLRWFLLFWESLVYLWAVLSLFGVNPLTLQQIPRLPRQTLFRPLPETAVDVLGIALFTVLMLAQGGLLWVSLSGKLPRSLTWLSFCLQGVLVLVIGLLVQQDNVVLNLYLALILSAIVLLRQVRSVVIVAVGYVLLFLASNQNWGTQLWSANILVDKTDYAALFLLVVGFLVLYIQQVRGQRQLAAANEQLQVAAERIEELTLLTERQRLARELHDTLAQGVAGFIMQLEAANEQLSQQRLPVVEAILQQALASARGTLADARSVIHDLRTIRSPDEFTEALEAEIRRFTTDTSIPCGMEIQAGQPIPASWYEPTVRFIGEGLQNAARHAQARNVVVRITTEAEMLVIEVQDDGIGFDPASLTKRPGHYGLIGLRERARLAGGWLEVHSAPGTGTTLRLLLPSQAEREATWGLPSAS